MQKEIPDTEKQKAALLTKIEILHLRQEALSDQIKAAQLDIDKAETEYAQLDPPPADPKA